MTDNGRPIKAIPNPREFMRARNPDLFSDTRTDDAFQLPKAVFEYHLDTLTSRKQEYEFEHFCRKLAEKEICPNLRVQTGPTGGGDSKVDTETYPVAQEIAERWWIGSPAAGAERWGFAFSAKKAWKPKAKADVDNILSTGRDYKRIYFFTNQFVSDKERSAKEDALSRYAGIRVHIVDRAWIVEKVYEAGHLDLAIATLGIEGARSEKINSIGPLDMARQAELKELDRLVADPSCYEGARYQLVEDCLYSAILARGLERPRSEVESRFALAERLAQDVHYRQQLLRISYNRAWTTYWWYEDFTAFSCFYDEVEQRVVGSDQAGEVELLFNLWQLLPPAVATGLISAQDANIGFRRQRLAERLDPIAADQGRLNNALQARTCLSFMKLWDLGGRSDALDSVWSELSQIVDEAARLGAYPLERLSKIITEFGGHFDSPAFDSLYEKLVDAVLLLRSEGEAGQAYTQRGVQKLQQKKPYEAIQWLGRAEELLIKEEFRGELVRALIAGSYAYERVGLLWAARNKALAAVERTLAVFQEKGGMIRPALRTLQRLVWIELQLGRIPHVLSAMDLASLIASHLKLSEDQKETYREELHTQEMVLGIHFLNLPFEALPSVARLPDALDRLGLVNARMALLFALGHEQALRNEGWIPASEDANAVQTFFEQWHDQPAAKDLPSQPVLVDGATSLLKSTILGAEFVFETPNNAISFGVTESVLGALEAFLATSDETDVLPHRECMILTISASSELASTPQLLFPEESGRAKIVHSADLTFKTATDRHDYMQWLQESLVQILSRMLIIRDIEPWIEKLAGQERGFSRALSLGDVLTLNDNVFGATPQLSLSDCLKLEDKSWPILRKGPWRVVKPNDPAETSDLRDPLKFGSGPPPTHLMDRTEQKHTDRRILSPIDIPLWDRAKWRATLFAWFPGELPMLALAFEDGKAGQEIFRAWRERWGNEDKEDALRLAIIRGLSKQNPAEYAVVVGPNVCHVKSHENKTFVTVSRINRMEPTSTANLDSFIAAYQRTGAFLLAPAHLGTGAPTPFIQLAIAKSHLHIRHAWEIGENDPDMSALHDYDCPIIPADIEDPPVIKALERIRNLRR
ncbi:MAG: hypothetical protein C0622_03040 [Desulfuromonas sp.]|nr:MAG: hypothetical protein C0622_03040 [Desulfuromonas sp.]